MLVHTNRQMLSQTNPFSLSNVLNLLWSSLFAASFPRAFVQFIKCNQNYIQKYWLIQFWWAWLTTYVHDHVDFTTALAHVITVAINIIITAMIYNDIPYHTCHTLLTKSKCFRITQSIAIKTKCNKTIDLQSTYVQQAVIGGLRMKGKCLPHPHFSSLLDLLVPHCISLCLRLASGLSTTCWNLWITLNCMHIQGMT